MNKTLARIGYAPLRVSEAGAITYDPIIFLKSTEAGGRDFSAEPNGDTNTIYADGLPVVVAEENAGYNIKVELLSAIDRIEKDWLGNIQPTEGGILEKNDTQERPRFALIAVKERFNATTKYEIDTYYNTIVSKRPSRNDKTSEGKFDPQFPTYELAATPRDDNKFVRYTAYSDTLPTQVVIPTIPSTPAVEGET